MPSTENDDMLTVIMYKFLFFLFFYQFTWKRKSNISLRLGYYFSMR